MRAGRLSGVRLVVLLVVLVLSACTAAKERGDSASAPEVEPRVLSEIDGVQVLDRGLTRWADGVVLRDPHVLRVMATGLDGPPTACDEAVVVRAVTQSAEAVAIEARRYELAEKPAEYSCLLIARGPSAHEVRLEQPLGDRRVFDAFTGALREVVSFDNFPTVQQVPAGYQWRPPSWDDERRVVTRSWGSREGSLTLEIGPVEQLELLPAVLKQGRIGDQQATVSRVIMLSCARWGPPDRTLNLCSRDAGTGDPPLDPDELLVAAASVR